MIRRLALAAAFGGTALALFAIPADAAAPTRIDDEFWGVTCVADLGDGQTIFLTGGGTTDGSEGGVGAFVEDENGYVGDGQADDWGFGEQFHASVEVAGQRFTITTDVTVGASETTVVNDRDGNSWTKGTQTVTALAYPGPSATWGGETIAVDADVCTGDINAFDVHTTNPAARIHADADFDSEICDIEGLADGQVMVGGVLPDAFVQIVLDHGGEDVEKLQGDVRLKGGRGTLNAEVLDYYTGDVRTTAEVGLTLSRSGKTVREVWSGDGMTETVSVTPYRETITVTFADGRQGSATCAGVSVVTKSRVAPAA